VKGEAATTRTQRVTHAFPLEVRDAVWIVESGKIDIFLAPMEAGSPTGALTHVLRVEAGGAVFTWPCDAQNFGFLAAPAAETTARVCSSDDFSAIELRELTAPWISGIAASIAGSDATLRQDQSLIEFHEWAAAELVRRRLQAHREEARRLSARTMTDEKLVSVAMRRLSRPLAPSGALDLELDRTSMIPLAAACLATGKSAGIHIKIPQSVLRGRARDPQRAIARHSAVRTRRLVLQGDWWTQDSGPMLAFLEADNRPVALLPGSGRGYDLFDPQVEEAVHVNRRTATSLSGIAYVFYRPFPHRPLSGAQVLLSGLRGCGRDLWTIAIAAFLASLLALVAPFATAIVFDSIIPGSERGQLFQTVLLILASAIAMILISLTRGYALLRVEGKLDFSTQAAVWDRLLNLPTTFFRNYSAGDLAYRSLAISQIRDILTGTVLTATLSGIFSVSSIFQLFYYSPALSLVAVALAGVALLVTVAAGFLQLRLQRQVAENAGRLAGMIFEFVEGIAKFKVSGTEGRAFARWASPFVRQKQMAAAVRRTSNVVSAFNASFPVIALMVIFAAVGGSLTTGGFLAFNLAFGQLMGSVLAFGGGILGLLRVVPLHERIKPIFETVPESDAGKADPGELTGSIEVSHLAFRYTTDTPTILQDVSLSIRPGEFVAFVGASGSGKSTLLRLLLGFEKPMSGAIYYDGQDLAGLDIQEVRLQMGVVLQNGKLMPGDILTNIIGSAPLTVNHAWEAARLAGLEEDIKTMSMGMYTVVSEGGRGLSGGQRQRLMIARAIVGKPRMLLWDEATSALDNRTQEIVARAMEQMQATRIVIAHRLSTIMKADRIFVLDRGVVAQSGTYSELMNQEGLFVQLAKRQMV
jgi:NHLM bacteriocin system ABC transporter ATP-binding protein